MQFIPSLQDHVAYIIITREMQSDLRTHAAGTVLHSILF